MIDLLMDGVRTIFAFVDSMVAFVISYLYQLIIAIADTNVFGNLIYHYLGRIYTFLGIFMVFKLSISMITYIINPDALTDKGKGFGKLISNVVISLILLVATPTLFDVAFDIQSDILSTNAVYQIVTGKKLSNTTTNDGKTNSLYSNAKYSGDQIAFAVFSSFIYADADEFNDNCDKKIDDGGLPFKEEECDSARVTDGDIDTLLEGETVRNDYNTYWFILSTAVGLVAAYALLTICFDVAMRSVKLGFLQIIAPIPIMLKMDPGAKDDKFSKWLKDVSSTFLSLFIRLAGLFFVTELIHMIMTESETLNMMSTYSNFKPGVILGTFARIFIIIGLLMFAKKLPQLISDLFGIKLDGEGFSLKKKVASAAGLGAALGVGALGAKKAIAGFDSMAHGKGFWNGTKNVQGNGFVSKMQKGWNEMTPNRAQYAKLRKEGREEVKKMDTDWNKGADIAQKLMGAGADKSGAGPNAWDKVFDGSSANRKYYEAIYKDKNFIDALMRVDAADSLSKEFSKEYRAIQAGGWSGPVTLGGKEYKTMTEFIDGMDTQEKILAGATANFESIKKQSRTDAVTQEQYKTIKGNKVNPTNSRETHETMGLKLKEGPKK